MSAVEPTVPIGAARVNPGDAVRRSALAGLKDDLEILHDNVEGLLVAFEREPERIEVRAADTASVARRVRGILDGLDQFGWGEASP